MLRNGETPQPAAADTRDLTHARILEAALKEFGLHGYRGARIEAIARRANVPRGLVAYYFGTKEGLFRAVASDRAGSIERIQHDLRLGPEVPFAWSLSLFALGEPALDWVHMLIWEGLEWESPDGEAPGNKLVIEETRRAFWQRRIAAVRAYQAERRLPARLAPDQLTFFLWVLGMYPYLLPQIAYLITGLWPSDRQFRDDFERFVLAIASRMQQASR
jgi:TetR/AcrR family transcriptional regulator